MLKQDFNAGWVVSELGAPQMEAGKGAVTLPHDAMIYTKRSADNPAGGACGWYAGGNYEYSKKFRIPEADAGKTMVLEFEGIYNRGYVYVNGSFVGSVRYGYTRLIADVTALVHYDAENEVKVKVINADVPNSRWYTGSGLYRPVNLYTGGDLRIPVDGLRVSTPDVDREVSKVRIEVQLDNDRKSSCPLSLQTIVRRADGIVVARESRPVTLLRTGRSSIVQHVYVRSPQLWSPDDPCLYTCEARLLSGEKILDSVQTTFGIRSVSIDPVRGMLLNGKKILLRGGCVHHDNGPLGAAAFARAEERKIELMKKAGFNAVRVAHNTASRALLDACDRLGILVMDESYDMWNNSMSTYDYALDFEGHWEEDLEDFTAKDFNHPSVIMYSIGNEIPETGLPDGNDWNRKLTQKLRELDPTRLVTNAINGLLVLMREGAQQMSISDAQDSLSSDGDINNVMTEMLGKMNELSAVPIVAEKIEESCGDLDLSGYNYMRGVYDIYKEHYPNRVFYGSETLPPDIDLNWEKVKSIPACIGDFAWTAWEYIGEAGVGVVDYDKPTAFMEPYPTYLAYCSDIDLIGTRRPISYFREIVFGLRKEPCISVQPPVHYGQKAGCSPWVVEDSIPSWTWGGYEGKPCKVEVYSDAEEVELLINGKSCGRLPSGEENRFRAIFDVTYEAGEVKAIAYRNGQPAESCELRTAGSEVRLSVQADRATIGVNEIAYLTISLQDAEGLLNTDTDRKVSVAVEGAGTLQALACADPASTENFYDQTRTTYYGKALAIIRAGEQAGAITVHVEAEGCDGVDMKLTVQ